MSIHGNEFAGDITSSWLDKIAYYFGVTGAFIGSTVQGMDLLTVISIACVLCTALISGTCQIARTRNDRKYKQQKIKLLEQIQAKELGIQSSSSTDENHISSALKAALNNEIIEQELSRHAKKELAKHKLRFRRKPTLEPYEAVIYGEDSKEDSKEESRDDSKESLKD